MTPERWQRIKELVASCLECAPTEWSGFLDGACAGDDSLRREVELLLASHEEEPDFMERPAVSEVAAEILKDDRCRQQAGRMLNHYTVLRWIGAGGMGEVYLAEDTRLGRKVAIKLLPDKFTGDEERLRRFEHEACAASTLNHPNILTIYEVGVSDGTSFIVTEYIEGETLRHRLTSAPLSIIEALDIAMQVASALAAAHEAGVVHRDIKPENIMLRRDQVVKVLDFGLAKLTAQAAQAHASLVVNTDAGPIMGTLAYMSPERVWGSKQVDHRTDIWSLGVVLYETVTGHKPFGDEDNQLVFFCESDPSPLARYIESVPEPLEGIVQKALAKEPDNRYQTARDLLIDLRDLKKRLEIADEVRRSISPAIAQPSTTYPAVTYGPYPVSKPKDEFRSRRKQAVVVSIALSIILATIAFVWHRFAGQDNSASLATSMRTVPFTSFPGQKSNPAFSPDGNLIAFAWDGAGEEKPGIFVKPVGAGSPSRLTSGSDGAPVWSHDGSELAFIRSGRERGIYRMSALGGLERKLTNRAGNFTWSPDGRTLAIADSPSPREALSIFLVSVETGEEQRLTTPEPASVGDTYPAYSPDGRSIAFIRSRYHQVSDIYLMPAGGGVPRRLTFDNLNLFCRFAWTADGREIVFSSSRGGIYSLWRIEVSGGSPRRVVGTGEYAISPSASCQGHRLAYVYQKRDINIWRAPGPNSKKKDEPPIRLIASTQKDDGMQYSPDGKRIAFTSDRSGNYEIWVAASDGHNPVQLTNFGGAHTGTPRWSPDGTRIAFDSRPDGQSSVYVIDLDGSHLRRVTEGRSEDILPSWSGDGRWIYFGSRRSNDWQIWKIPAAGGQAARVTRDGGNQAFESWGDQYVYYTKHHETGIWRMPIAGGEESRVFDGGRMCQWALLKGGICFLNLEAVPQPAIDFFNFGTRRVTRLIELERSKAPSNSLALDVSQDGQWIIYWQTDQLDSEIMLVENFM
jgi:eukaryotic-like serine/threonine-protein kinase